MPLALDDAGTAAWLAATGGDDLAGVGPVELAGHMVAQDVNASSAEGPGLIEPGLVLKPTHT